MSRRVGKWRETSPFLSCSEQAGDRITPVCPNLVPGALALLLSLLVGHDTPATQTPVIKSCLLESCHGKRHGVDLWGLLT